MSKIKWKFGKCKGCVLYYVVDKATQKPLLYLILKDRHIKHSFSGRYKGFKIMTLMDFGILSLEEKNFDILLSIVSHFFWESNAEILEIVTSSPILVHKARHRGYIRVGRGVDFWFKSPPQLNLTPDCTEIRNWHITHFACDGFSFE
jgi:hypothetical protein